MKSKYPGHFRTIPDILERNRLSDRPDSLCCGLFGIFRLQVSMYVKAVPTLPLQLGLPIQHDRHGGALALFGCYIDQEALPVIRRVVVMQVPR